MTARKVGYPIAAVWQLIAIVWLSSSAIAHANEHYQIDSHETTTSYQTRYLGIFLVHGLFDRITGVLRYDPAKPPAERDAFIHVVIDATTLRPTTFNSETKRAMLRGPEFFNVEKYPTIEFVSSVFRFDDGKLIAIDGALTLTGVTKPG